jgi:hypothetical protein
MGLFNAVSWDYIRSSHQFKKKLFFIPEILYITVKRYILRELHLWFYFSSKSIELPVSFLCI